MESDRSNTSPVIHLTYPLTTPVVRSDVLTVFIDVKSLLHQNEGYYKTDPNVL